jgi:acetamidase/formamidase
VTSLVNIEGEPGDLLEMALLDISTLRNSLWEFTEIFPKEHGSGFLTNHFATAQKQFNL